MLNRILRDFRLRCCLSFFLLLFLCLLFPYTGDDWAWGTSIGLKRLATWFKDYNGRYVGNLVVLALTRSRVLCAIVTAAVMVGICAQIRLIVGKDWVFELAALFLLAIPKAIGAQTVVFASGFANYSLSAFLFLLFTAAVFKETDHAARKPAIKSAALAAVGFAGCLIVEHVTICTVLLSLASLLYIRRTRGRWSIPLFAHFLGATAGAVWMFSNTAYRMVIEKTDTYRSFSGGGLLSRAVKNYLSVIYREGYLNNALLNAALFLVCLAGFFLLRKKLTKRLAWHSLMVMGLFSAYSLFAVIYVTDARQGHFLHAEAAVAFFGLVGTFASLLFLAMALGDREVWEKLLFTMAAILLFLAPLFLVTPVTSRCFMASYVAFVLLLCLTAKMCVCALEREKPDADETRKAIGTGMRKILLLGITALYVFYMGVYYSVHKVDVSRLEHIRADVAAGRQETEILHFPYESFLWTGTPLETNVWGPRYKLFHGIPSDVRLIAVWEYSENAADG